METSQIGIHTICYAPGMVELVDPAFLPFDVTANPETERRETAHMLNFWRQGMHRKYRAAGLLSPKFKAKTGFDGNGFIDLVRNNPDFDVWFTNPYPALFYLSYNIWEHGEHWHPGLCDIASKVFRAAKVPVDPSNFPRSAKNTLLFANFWVGTPKFWDRFMPFVETVLAKANEIEDTTNPTSYVSHKSATFWPFFAERLFTTFLTMNPDIKRRFVQFELSHMLQMSTNNIETLLLREWAPMIDLWDAAHTYNKDRRAIFQGLHKLYMLGILRNNPALLKTTLDL